MVSIKTLRNGYDLPVKGLDNGFFYPIHIVALTMITVSFACALTILIISFRRRAAFFGRPKTERFVVYLAICDGAFNIFHSMDHLHYLTTKSHPRPPALCSFYSFMMFIFVMSQMMCVNAIAINAFYMMYFGKSLYFGKYDYRLLCCIFGLPICLLTISAILNKLGPNGYFCAMDGVTGGAILLMFTTAPSILILVVNCILYALIWQKLRTESKRIQDSIGKEASSAKASHRAVRTMMLFVVMFVIQWTASSVFGVWEYIDDAPPFVVLFTVLLANSGGLLNGFIFIYMYRKRVKTENETTMTTKA